MELYSVSATTGDLRLLLKFISWEGFIMMRKYRRRKINYYRLLELIVKSFLVVAFCYYLFGIICRPLSQEEIEESYKHNPVMIRKQYEIAVEKERQENAAKYHTQEAKKKEAWLLECERKYDAQREAERQNFIQHRRDPRGVISVAE